MIHHYFTINFSYHFFQMRISRDGPTYLIFRWRAFFFILCKYYRCIMEILQICQVYDKLRQWTLTYDLSKILYTELFYIMWTLLQIGTGLYRTYYVDNNNIILNAFCCRSIAVYLYEGHAIHQHKYISRCLIPNTMLYNICQIQSNLIDEKSFFGYFFELLYYIAYSKCIVSDFQLRIFGVQ